MRRVPGLRLVAIRLLEPLGRELAHRLEEQLLREFWAIEVSVGAISGMEARASAALEPAFKQAEPVSRSTSAPSRALGSSPSKRTTSAPDSGQRAGRGGR